MQLLYYIFAAMNSEHGLSSHYCKNKTARINSELFFFYNEFNLLNSRKQPLAFFNFWLAELLNYFGGRFRHKGLQ